MANPWKEQQLERKAKDLEALKVQCMELVRRGKRIDAIRLYRSKTGASLERAMVELRLS